MAKTAIVLLLPVGVPWHRFAPTVAEARLRHPSLFDERLPAVADAAFHVKTLLPSVGADPPEHPHSPQGPTVANRPTPSARGPVGS